MLKWSTPLSIWVAWSTPLLAADWAEVRSCVGLAIWHSSILHELAGKKIWKSSIRLDNKIRLYQTYTVPVLLYGCETWSITKLQCSRIDAFDMWALRQILRIPFILAVWRMWKSEQPPDAVLLPTRSLTVVCGSLDIAHSSPQEDHHRAVAAVIRRLPPDWKRPVQENQKVASCNGGTPWPTEHWPCIYLKEGSYSWRLAAHIVDTATLQRSMLWKKKGMWP